MGYSTSSAKISSAESTVASSIVVINDPVGGGFLLSGSKVSEAGVNFSAQPITPGAASVTTSVGTSITSVIVTDSSYNNLDDTAISNTLGGYAKIIGTNFQSGCTVYINGSSVTSTFVNSNEVRIVVPATSTGTYSLMLFNPDGTGAIYLNLTFSTEPTFTTAAGSLGNVYEYTSFSNTVAATGNTPVTFSLYSGTLPPNVILYSNGVISGTTPAEAGQTTYSFVIKATDVENQDSTRTFNITINTDVVTWSSPANNTTYTISNTSPISNVVLSATSGAGKSLTYTVNSLPSGLTLTGNTISGTPNSYSNTTTSSLLTATATDTGKTKTLLINWSFTVPPDVFFYKNILMLSGQGSNNAENSTFVDSSNNSNLTITRNGNATQGSFTPYGNKWSYYFDGNGDYVSTTSFSTLALGSGDFTTECWIYPVSSPAQNIIFDMRTSDAAGANTPILYLASNVLRWRYNGTNYLVGNTSPTLNDWSHVAVSKSGSTISMYLNGALVSSNTDTTTYTSGLFQIGKAWDANHFTGYISNFRIVKGNAVYTGNFTVPTGPLTAVANTQLLTCHSGMLYDASPNNLTMTKAGDTKAIKYYPFANTDGYSTSNNSGSIYFDGTGDYLGVTGLTALGTGDFTIDGWVYATGAVTNRGVYQLSTAAVTTTLGLSLAYYTNGNGWQITYGSGSSFTITSLGIPTLGVWYHFAMSRQSGTLRTFINGVLGDSRADTTNYTGTVLAVGGYYSTSQLLIGYTSDVRVVKGSALYTSTFTPPTTPSTVVANTSILLSGTNGGIIDYSMKNNIETVGNAIISTTSYKYGSSSIYFDGTGDYLKASNPVPIGTADFTIEFWFNASRTATYQGIVDFRPDATDGLYPCVLLNNSNVAFWISAAARLTAAFSTNTWYHVAICRTNGVSKIYLNGVASATTYTDTNNYIARTTAYTIGALNTGSNGLQGYLQDLRITYGKARYTSDFTPPDSVLSTQ